MVVFGQSSCIQAEVVVFVQKGLYSRKVFFIRAKVGVLVQSGCIRAKEVVIGESGCIRAKVVVFGKIGCSRGKLIALGQEWLYSERVVVFEQK